MLGRIILGLMALILSTSAWAIDNCEYTFQKEEGKKYDISSIRDFVIKEIRPTLADEEHMYKINIHKTCGSKKTTPVVIDMKSNNYYLLWINGQELPSDIVRYDNRLEIDIDRDTLIWAINKTPDLDFNRFMEEEDAETYAEKKALMYQHAVLKMFAFVFAEAARFSSVEQALMKTIEGNCSIDWHDFDFIVHAWRHTSDFIRLTNMVQKSQYSNGWDKPLYAPITTEQEVAYEKALMEGKDFAFDRTVPFFEYEYVCLD
ncbi:hypothetical protein [Vibrio splendidus]|jgi:hypothetical protein|uniref:hypothetical protein n=1 Tax=Vibrio splendidus TaxID=29497 RepID=UPI00211803D9|nr:hypothetical protein [Vibrio splendidus]MCQ8868182.1 hypothetical protein [Vibrio splendidus]